MIFGKDTHLKIGEILKDYNCHKILIHYGGKSAVKSGLIDDIKKCLTDAGFDFVTLGGVVPNPRLSKVREGISLCRKENIDFILAGGGGSVIDSAKAIGYGVANPWTDVWNFFLKTMLPRRPAMVPPKMARAKAATTVTGALKAKGAKRPGMGEAVPGALLTMLRQAAATPAKPPPRKLEQ